MAFADVALADDRRYPIHLGTDCTGLGSVCIALSLLNVAFKHMFATECDATARWQLQSGLCRAAELHDDIHTRRLDGPPVDLYVCGFPCQTFAAQGNREGFSAGSRGRSGQIIFPVLTYIRRSLPRLFVLENVQGLGSVAGGACMAYILRSLYNLPEYNIYWDLVNTKDHGIPHNRPRYYFIGIAVSHDRGTFSFPDKLPERPLESVLENRLSRPSATDLPRGSVARRNVMSAVARLQQQGRDPFEEPWTLNCDSTADRADMQYDCSPCITRGRAAGHWLCNRGRRLSLLEMMRLQGFPDNFQISVSETAFSQMLGNSMSINVLARILARALPTAGLGSFVDPWDQ